MTVGAVILNWNHADLTEAAVRSVAPSAHHVYVVDNGSDTRDLQRLRGLRSLASVTVLENGSNLGYAAGNNRGIAKALQDGHDAILVLNNDATVAHGSLEALAARLCTQSAVGVVAPVVVDAASGMVLHTVCTLDARLGRVSWGDSGKSVDAVDATVRTTPWVSGVAFLARSAVFESCGFFDPRFFCYFEDVDWSLRARRRGWRLEVVPTAIVAHHVGASSTAIHGHYYRARNRMFFLRWSLGKGAAVGVLLSMRPIFAMLAALVRRRHFRVALHGVLRGWVAGIVEA